MLSWISSLQADTVILTFGGAGILAVFGGLLFVKRYRPIMVSLGMLSFLLAYGLYVFIQVGHPEVFAKPSKALGPLSQQKHQFVEFCWSAALGCEGGDQKQCTNYDANRCPSFPEGQKRSDFLEALLHEEQQWLQDCITIALRCDHGDQPSCGLYERAHCGLFEN